MKSTILAASYIGPEGHGNDRTGLRVWTPELSADFERGDFSTFHWSHLFSSDPARFARMDLMCRFGLAAVELLDAGLESLSESLRDQTGVCVETRVGSIANDLDFLKTPRASLFTYTLPSTLIGEICIRYRLRGPVRCLMPTRPNESLSDAMGLIDTNEADSCVFVSCDVAGASAHSLLPEMPRAWHCLALLLGKSDKAKPIRLPIDLFREIEL